MNQTTEVLRSRRSCRAYKSDMVPKEIIETIIESGLYAASGMNRQPWKIIAITSKEKRDALSRLNARIMGKDESVDPFYGAPVILMVLADSNVPTYVYDGSLVMGNLMLEAHNQGIASCWIHRAKEESECAEGKALLQELGIPESYVGIGHCILGYAASEPREAAPRKEDSVYFIE